MGFANVIDAFHVVDQAEVPQRFFVDERRSGSGIRLTDGLRELLDEGHGPNLREEVEARWRLVETARELDLPRQLLTVEFQRVSNTLVVPRQHSLLVLMARVKSGHPTTGSKFGCRAGVSFQVPPTEEPTNAKLRVRTLNSLHS